MTVLLHLGGSNGLLISGDIPLELSRRHDLSGIISVEKGQCRRLSLAFRNPAELSEGNVGIHSIKELDRRFHETASW